MIPQNYCMFVSHQHMIPAQEIHTPAKQIMMFCASNFLCFAFPVTLAKRSDSADSVENESMTLTITTKSFRLSITNASLPMVEEGG